MTTRDSQGRRIEGSAVNSREMVFKAIDGERAYQNVKHPRADSRAQGSIITLIDTYLMQAKLAYATEDNVKVQDAFRKVAALAVLGMETHGIQFRE